jgi:outer membrane autotransporter protein
VTCTFISERDASFVKERTKRIISNFLARRADQLTASDPDLVGRLIDRRSSRGIDSVPLSAVGSDDGASTELQIHRAGLAVGQWGLWTEGRWSTLDGPATDGNLGLAYIGIDYAASRDFVAGIMAQFDFAATMNRLADYEIGGFGWLAGPYAVARIGTNAILDARLAWGTSQNDISPLGTYEDAFSTERVLARLRLTGDFYVGDWQIQPQAGALFFEEKQKSYSDSLGNRIDGQTVSLARMTFGPKLRTNITIPGGVLQPFAAIHGVWDFKREALKDIDTADRSYERDLHARINAGFAIEMMNDTRLTIDGTIDGIGSGFENSFGVSAQVYLPID